MKNKLMILVLLISVGLLVGCENNVKAVQQKDATETQTQMQIQKTGSQQAEIQTTEVSKKLDSAPIIESATFDQGVLSVLKTIESYYPDFKYSNEYTVSDTESNPKQMIFSAAGGLYFDTYVSYGVTFFSDENLVHYVFDAGTAWRGYGFYYILDDHTVIKIEKSFGTESYIYEISKNGELIDGTEYSLVDKHPIEIEYEAAMENWSGNTAEGVDIIMTYGELWTDEMEKYYNLLFQELNDEKKQWLVSAQEKWEDYAKENDELQWQIYDQNFHGGSLMQIFSAGIYYDKYHDRALELIEMYDVLMEAR